MNSKHPKKALLLIDIQKGLDDYEYYGGNRNNPEAELKMSLILKTWRELNLPVYHIQHSSPNTNSKLHPTHPGFQLKDDFLPKEGEVHIVKHVNSAFIGTDLKERLDNNEIESVIIIGLTTNHCVSSTARMAANYGFKTTIISDATATFDRIGINGEHYDSETIHLTTLASLRDEFAMIMTTNELLSSLQ